MSGNCCTFVFMENNNKYYTPTIDEFYVGFECELRNSSDDNNFEWEQFKIATVDDGLISNSLMDWSFYDSRNAIEDQSIRVKYLDKEDIESLGWKQSRESNCSEIEFIMDLGNRLDNLGLIYDEEDQYLRIHWFGEGDITRFSGTIKNKSELKKLMKQLDINE